MSSAREIITYERNIYFKDKKAFLKEWMFHSDTFYIWKYMKLLRHEEEWRGRYENSRAAFLPLLWYRSRKNKLGLRLGFDIPAGVLGKGARIYHQGQVVINPKARVGNDSVIIGNLCIGNDGKEDNAAEIGNHCTLSWGVTVIGSVFIADNCLIGAGAVVTHDIKECYSVAAGVPARVIGKMEHNRIER